MSTSTVGEDETVDDTEPEAAADPSDEAQTKPAAEPDETAEAPDDAEADHGPRRGSDYRTRSDGGQPFSRRWC